MNDQFKTQNLTPSSLFQQECHLKKTILAAKFVCANSSDYIATKFEIQEESKQRQREVFEQARFEKEIGEREKREKLQRQKERLEKEETDKRTNLQRLIRERASGHFNWRLFAVYGPHYDRDKTNFWEMLTHKVSACDRPWVVMGDLNCILNNEEKMGGKKVTSSDTRWLEDFLQDTGGVDLRFKGCQFTWQNKRFNGGLIRERLDRCIGSYDWSSAFPSAGILNFQIMISDHAPILFDTFMFKSKGFIPFLFYDAWSREDSCRDEICKAWSKVPRGGTRSLLKNFDNIRRALQKWRKEKVGDLDQRISTLENRLQWIQRQQITEEFCREEFLIQDQLQETWRKKESMWSQKSRELWLKLEDRSTRFFHTAASVRRRRNQVWHLQDKDGNMKDNTREISEVFRSGIVHQGLNFTFICLIPKVNNPTRMEQFRPISLCNFPYKIIAKILANRLRSYMESLISPLQSAFILGRWIVESSILTQELVHTIRKKRGVGGLMAIKLDMHKAYDRMEWDFVRKVLQANRFDDKACGLLMSCITGVSYSVLMNDTPLKKFKPQRGLRQGDPLSPYIFLLCQEVLSKIIQSQENRGKIHGIRIARAATPISHLMFADDTILFARANTEEATNLMGCLNLYERWSGQVCSRAKSSVLFLNNLDIDKRKAILQMLTIKQSDGEERHLGNPFVFKRMKKDSFLKLRESMLQKLAGWKMRLLSYAGRLTLIKSVASAMSIYAMSTNRVPISICRELDALLRAYWWQGQVNKGSKEVDFSLVIQVVSIKFRVILVEML
ncbi:uncharacterized protein LOC133035936 [Cannabis sativa]|uniref:uncharacterized protein LOC133035936 n=1 Tax=Cannabis sativa TaxID=3483 RepID=UPI0029C9F905|nr:uncharacterized protein LOC133035936 [Cannabis sativa]